MQIILSDYYLAYTEGKKELEIPLEQPTLLSEVLRKAHIPVWEVQLAVVNGKAADDLSILVGNEDVVRVYPAMNGG